MATQTQVAEALSVSIRLVQELVARNIITKKARGEYDIKQATNEYISHLREMAAGRANAGDLDLAEERARLAKEQADAKEMENAILRGDLVHIEDVAKIFEEQLTACKTKIMAVPSKAAPLVISCDNIPEAKEAIEELIIEALNELVGYGSQEAS